MEGGKGSKREERTGREEWGKKRKSNKKKRKANKEKEEVE